MAPTPLVGIIMGSRSDLRIMSHAADLLAELDVPHEVRVVSAHRTPDWMFEYATGAESRSKRRSVPLVESHAGVTTRTS